MTFCQTGTIVCIFCNDMMCMATRWRFVQFLGHFKWNLCSTALCANSCSKGTNFQQLRETEVRIPKITIGLAVMTHSHCTGLWLGPETGKWVCNPLVLSPVPRPSVLCAVKDKINLSFPVPVPVPVPLLVPLSEDSIMLRRWRIQESETWSTVALKPRTVSGRSRISQTGRGGGNEPTILRKIFLKKTAWKWQEMDLWGSHKNSKTDVTQCKLANLSKLSDEPDFYRALRFTHFNLNGPR